MQSYQNFWRLQSLLVHSSKRSYSSYLYLMEKKYWFEYKVMENGVLTENKNLIVQKLSVSFFFPFFLLYRSKENNFNGKRMNEDSLQLHKSPTDPKSHHKDWICQIQYIYILLRFKIERFVLLQLNFGGRGWKWSGWIEPQYSDYWNNKSHQKDIFHGLVMVLQPFQVERVLCLKMELMHLIKITISCSLSFNLAEI